MPNTSDPPGEVSWETLKANFVARLRDAMRGSSINGFARRAGLSASSVHRILHGGEPSLSTVFQLATAAGVSPEWLMTGSGPGLDGTFDTPNGAGPGTPGPEDREPESGQDPPIRSIRPYASAGLGSLVHEEVFDTVRFPASILDHLGLAPERACLAEVTGTSMEPLIQDGSVVLLDTSDTEMADGRIYALTLNGELMIKRLRRARGGIVLVSENREIFPEERIGPSDQFAIAGRVRWAGRRF